MKKAVILTADQFEDLEVMYPMMRLQEAGWQVDVAAPKIKQISGEFGYGQIMPDVLIDKVNPDDYDLLIIPGGSPEGAPAVVRKIKKAQEITQSFFEKNKPVASICHGPWLLADSGVVQGRKLTCFWHDGVPESVKEAGATWMDEEVVVDNNLVTSRWPADLPAFMREVMKLVK